MFWKQQQNNNNSLCSHITTLGPSSSRKMNEFREGRWHSIIFLDETEYEYSGSEEEEEENDSGEPR